MYLLSGKGYVHCVNTTAKVIQHTSQQVTFPAILIENDTGDELEQNCYYLIIILNLQAGSATRQMSEINSWKCLQFDSP